MNSGLSAETIDRLSAQIRDEVPEARTHESVELSVSSSTVEVVATIPLVD